jgi:putative oxygen-independent coproporphyrinogen III oxidase
VTIAFAAPPARSAEWQVDPGFGVYVHIPFCRHRCHYCDFNTYEGQEDQHAAYVDALVGEIERWSGPSRPATSVFFGGGTPTLLPPTELARVLAAIRRRVGITPDAEITVEANPETLDHDYLVGLRRQGFARISIGVQSLVPKVLSGLGRAHPPEVAVDAIVAARAAGFDDINADLIYGSPWESENDWEASLRGVIDAGVDHVSAYALTVEEATPLATLIRTGRVPDVDPDVQARRHAIADDLLERAGFHRYEISNWARPGRASRHNVLYWCAGDYLGFGAGAHAHQGGRRWWATRLPRDFIAAVRENRSTLDGEEVLSSDERAGEALMLGLRLRAGVDKRDFETRYGPEPLRRRVDVLSWLEGQGLLRADAQRVQLTERGTLLANEALCRLL